MAPRKGNKLDEYTISVGGVDLTVQLTAEEAEAQNARRGRADADKTVTTGAKARAAQSIHEAALDERAAELDAREAALKAAQAPANKAAAAPANK